ncbi:MAG TPA: methyl-accepting chemotaxis protein [Dissulfurispiraceae bacterium]|nr:methyl-accepting chemotaxis protein [Dissulfurispiraceae bacterium]
MNIRKFMNFRNLPIFWKISSLPIMAMGITILGMLFFLLPKVDRMILSEKQAVPKTAVETAYGIVEYYSSLADSGKMAQDKAQEAAKDAVRAMHFGSSDDYVWINDASSVIVHPKAEIEGRPLSEFSDAKGFNVFQEATSLTQKQGEGFITYLWKKAGEAEPQEKISFVKMQKKWGWVIGSGIYKKSATLHLWITSMVFLAAVSALITALAFLIGGGLIARPVKQFEQRLHELAAGSGDLTKRIEFSAQDELGAFARDINSIVHNFGEKVDGTLAASTNIVNSVEDLRGIANRTASGAKTQASQASQIAASAEEMSQTITTIAHNASEASQTSQEAMKTATAGQEITENAISSISHVNTSTVELSQMMASLTEKAQEIGTIVTAIKDIADQTNLLALNAAIEAARAGEQGRGFAVVADEVRKLAERTSSATEDITGKISSIQNEIAMTTRSMDTATGEVENATGLVREVGNALQQIVEASHKVNSQVTQIATAVEEQSSASEEVAMNIEKTSIISGEIEQHTQEILRGSGVIVDAIDQLRIASAGFRTGKSGSVAVELGRADLKNMVSKFEACAAGSFRLAASSLPDYRSSRFGLWYESARSQFAGKPAFADVERLSERFHAAGAGVVTQVNASDTQGVEKALQEMRLAAEAISRKLTELA